MTEFREKHALPAGEPTASPRPGRRRWMSYAGPGLVLAAASVGAGDLITPISGASIYGMGLLWVAAVGVLIKFGVTEAVGRHFIASGRTIVASAGSVARWVPYLFFAFFLVIALVYGAGLSSVASLAVAGLVPGTPAVLTPILISLIAAGIVLWGRYNTFENVMKYFILVKFGLMLALAVITLAQAEDLAPFLSTLRPTLPTGSLIDVIALIGGVGGTAGIAAYGYWVREKGWRVKEWLPIMRLDAAMSYATILLFVVATTIVGTGMVYGSGRSVQDADGLAALADPIGAHLGSATRALFLVTFLMVVMSALVGGFNALAYLLADSLRTIRLVPDEQADAYVSENSWVFRGFVLLCLVSSVTVMFTGQPVTLVLLYASAGSLVLPLLAATLLVLLNRKDVAPQFRNRLGSNSILGAALAMFVVLAAVQVAESF